MKYRKKPVIIQAIQWDGGNFKQIEKFCIASSYQDAKSCAELRTVADFHEELFILTLEGEHIASIGDYIIKGVKGEFYPCKPDIFHMTYERVNK